jgi:hypothetical protein
MTANGAGLITGGLTDTNVGGTVGQGLAVSGTYTIASNGRGTSTITAGGLTNSTAVYVISNNTAYTVGLDTWGTGISFFSPRGAGPFSVASLNGHCALALRGTLSSPSTDITGQILLNGQGDLAGVVDVNASGVLSENVPVTGVYTMDATGRGQATISSATSTWLATIYFAGPGTVYLLGTSYPSTGCLVRQF